MATGTQASVARLYHTDQVHYVARNILFSDGDGAVLDMGWLPDGATILKAQSGVIVHEAFDAGTANTLDIGTEANDDIYGSALALGSVAQVALDEAVDYRVSGDTKLIATLTVSGTAATAGAATALVAYILPGR